MVVVRSSPGGEVTDAEEVFAALYPQLRRFAAVVASPDTDPDDLVQEALARVLHRGSLLDIEHPAAYLRQAILHLEVGHRRQWARRRARAHRVPAQPEALTAEYPSDLAILGQVAPLDRAVLFLAEVEGMPYRDIADLLDGDEATLRARASKARKRLRAELREEDR